MRVYNGAGYIIINYTARDDSLLAMVRHPRTAALRPTMALGPMITNTSVPVIINLSHLSRSYHWLTYKVQFLTVSHEYNRLSNPRDTAVALTPLVRDRRSMSTGGGVRGRGAAAPPGEISGFGRRQKPKDSGNTALGKGFDLMEDDPESRKKIVIGG